MSNSVHNDSQMSTGTVTEENGGEDEGDYFEEFVWNLMGKTGLLSELKSRIALFIQQNGGMVPGVSVIPSRADPVILQYIYEYLQWVGMKNTASLLITESPVSIDVNTLPDSDSEQPALCALFENMNKGSTFYTANQTRSTVQSFVDTDETLTPAAAAANRTYTSKFMGTPPSASTTIKEKESPLIPLGESIGEDHFSSMHSEPVDSPGNSQKDNSASAAAAIGNVENGKDEEPKSNGDVESKLKPPAAKTDDEDDTFSDLLLEDSVQDNTQDLSIESDSRGMSSCEHVVNLK